MKNQLFAYLALAFFSSFHPQFFTLHAQGTAFTYQGRLNAGGVPANGAYDFRFRLFDAPTNGNFSGGVMMLDAVGVSNGLFTVVLGFNNQFLNGSARWLDIGVKTNGGPDYDYLVPRQAVTPTPYAITAGNVTGMISDSQLSGNVARLNSNAVFTGTVSFNNAASEFNGSFTGNGAGVTNTSLLLNSRGTITANSSLFTLTAVVDTSYPAVLVAADVNGDGSLDLVTPISVSTALQILTNDGSGGFVPASTVGVGHSQCVTAADVNGDGSVDLIGADVIGNKLTISTNNGLGVFTTFATPSVGVEPLGVVAADVNGDSRVDLITANNSAGTLSVVFNNGPSGFILASSPSVGTNPICVAAADVNGDSRVDLISANSGTNTLSVLTNNGNGFFTLKATLTVGLNPNWVVAADVNGDGRMDLVSANFGNDTLSVLTNTGSGGFLLAATLNVGAGPLSVAAADVNQDGSVDLVSANFNTNTLTVLTNNGSGGFVLATTLNAGPENKPRSLVIADVNSDGRPDVINSNGSQSSHGDLTVFLNTAFDFLGNFTGHFRGSLDAASITSGTLDDHRLSDNVARVNKAQTFYANQAFAATAQFDGPAVFTGNVGVGTTNPAVGFQVARGLAVTGASSPYTGAGAGVFIETGGGIGQLFAFNYTPFLPLPLALNSPGGNVGIGRTPVANKLEVEGNASKTAAGSWLANSDARIKTDVQTVTGALDKLAQVRLVQFHYTEDYRRQHPSIADRSYLNVIAQEFQNVFPDDVKSSGEKLPDGSDILQVDAYPLTIYAAAAIQELNEKVEGRSKKAEDQMEELKQENTELKARLEKLEQLLGHRLIAGHHGQSAGNRPARLPRPLKLPL